MNRRILIGVALTGAVLLGGCATQEYVDRQLRVMKEQMDAGAKYGASAPKRAVRAPAIDADGNASISLAEYMAARERFHAANIAPMDSNGDGRVSPAEYAAFGSVGPVILLHKAMDANRDGKVSRQEYEASRRDDFAQMIKDFDRDNDGQISKDEFLAYAAVEFGQRDRNQNGMLEKDEARSAPNAVSRMMPADRQFSPKICSDPCPWVWSWGWDLEPGNGTGGCDSDWCPDPTHPGCTIGDVRSGNCVEIWPGYYAPFF